jgi:KaiC/GvpD/RAD55 family RecA-like ATPase
VWDGLAAKQIKFRRGQVCLVAASSGTGKSMFAMIYAIKVNVPTMYFSADSDTATIMMRAASHLSGHNQITVEQNLSNDSHYYDKHFDKLKHIKWVFDSSPSLDDIELEIKAYVELYGEPPELIIIDNLMNIAAEKDDEWAGLRLIMKELHDMARKTEACVMVLHHVSEQTEYGSLSKPSHRRAIKGKVTELPSLILTMGHDPVTTELHIAPVKNRFGFTSVDASEYTSLIVNFGACQISDRNSFGAMLQRDAKYGYTGNYNVDEYGNEVDE